MTGPRGAPKTPASMRVGGTACLDKREELIFKNCVEEQLITGRTAFKMIDGFLLRRAHGEDINLYDVFKEKGISTEQFVKLEDLVGKQMQVTEVLPVAKQVTKKLPTSIDQRDIEIEVEEAEEEKLPDKIGRYTVIKKLGEGGMGIVYKAYDAQFNRYVAIKVIKGLQEIEEEVPENAGDDTKRILGGINEKIRKKREEQLKRFEREARVTGELTHPNIINIQDKGTYEGRNYFVMNYVKSGKDLSGLFKEIQLNPRKYEEKQILRMFAKSLEALAYMHSPETDKPIPGKPNVKRSAIIHRDLKPENIMIDEFGQVYIMDFGLGKAKGAEDPVLDSYTLFDQDSVNPVRSTANLSEVGLVVGTPTYMPREQWQNMDWVDERSDIYCMGATLYELVTGTKFRPTEIEQDGRKISVTIPRMAIMSEKNEFVRPRKANPKISPELESIILKAVEQFPLEKMKKDAEEYVIKDIAEIRKIPTTKARKEFEKLRIDIKEEMLNDKITEIKDKYDYRYRTAKEFLEDIQRYIEGEKVKVHNYGIIGNTKRFVKEYAMPLMAGSLLFLAGIGGFALNANKNTRIEHEQRISAEAKAKAAKEETARKDQEKITLEERAKTAEDKASLADALIEYGIGMEFLYKRNDSKTALEHFENAIKLKPTFPDAYFQRGVIKYGRLKSKEAIEDFVKANELRLDKTKGNKGEAHVPALFYAGFVSIDLDENPTKASEYFNQLLQVTSDEKQEYVSHAKCCVAFTKGAELAKRARTAELSGKNEEAKSLSQKAQEQFAEMVSNANEAIEIFPQMWEGYLLKALTMMQGIGGGFNHPGLSKYRDWASATEKLAQGLQMNPGQPRCQVQRIWTYLALNERKKALEDAKLLVQMYPGIPAFVTVKGFAHYMNGEHQTSLECLLDAEKSGDTGATNAAFQALNYLQLQRYEDAEKYFTKAIDQTRQPVYYAQRSSVRLKLKNIDGALEDANEAIKLDKQNGRAYCNRGLCYSELNDFNKAVADFNQSIALGFEVAHLELGFFYAKKHNQTSKPEYLEEARKALSDYINTNNPYRRKEAIDLLNSLK